MVLSADDKLLGLLAGVERRKIGLAVAHISDAPLCRNLGGIASIYFFRLATAPGNAPHGLLGASGSAGRIRILAGGVLAFATNVNDGVGVVGKIHVRDGLAVVFEIRGELAGLKCRSFRYPDVALAFLVESPVDAIGFFGGFQVFWKRRAQELLGRGRLLRP